MDLSVESMKDLVRQMGYTYYCRTDQGIIAIVRDEESLWCYSNFKLIRKFERYLGNKLTVPYLNSNGWYKSFDIPVKI